MTSGAQTHWDTVYGEKSEHDLSWHQDAADISVALIDRIGLPKSASVIDIGGGISRLPDALLAIGLHDLTVLDLSPVALKTAQNRLGRSGETITWVAADITSWHPERRYDLWHDRAVFHFLVDPSDRAAYLEALDQGVKQGGHVIIATFAPDGPEKCSGLPVVRYSSADLAKVLGDEFELLAHQPHEHKTPWGASQSFQFSLFRRAG